MTQPTYPSLFQVSTRAWLTELSAGLGRPATLDDIPDAALDRIARNGFDWVWPLGVWQTGAAGQEVSRSRPEWRREYQETLPDLTDTDICGSCFAITAYRVHRDLGGNAALERLRRRLADRGLKLMLDFVPNHVALDHPWIEDHPDYFIAGSEADLARTPENYCRVETTRGPIVLAHGRDPYFPGWPDTLQLNYGNPELQQAMRGEILAVAALCDGVRCDMAMLILPEVFQRTWGIAIDSFWPDATAGARRASPGFTFMAEVYWDLEWTLMQQGFDYAYDKRLYDRLVAVNSAPHQGQCRIALPVSEFSGKAVRLADLMSDARYQRQGDDLVGSGLYLDMPAWGYHVFDLIVESRDQAGLATRQGDTPRLSRPLPLDISDPSPFTSIIRERELVAAPDTSTPGGRRGSRGRQP